MQTDPNDPMAPACGFMTYASHLCEAGRRFHYALRLRPSRRTCRDTTLAHLINDALITKVKPRMMNSIHVNANERPPPPGVQGGKDADAAASCSAGYGRLLYVMEQETGLCGSEGDVGPFAKLGTTCLSEKVRASFYENLLVIQEEQKILCYPKHSRSKSFPST